MKPEYFDIKLRLEHLSRKGEEEQTRLFVKLIPKLKRNFIRIEIYFEPEYYLKILKEEQKLMQEYLEKGEYWNCADVRGNILFYQKKIYHQVLLFSTNPPPQFIIDQNGLVLCYLHSQKNKHLIEMIQLRS